mmetsp:Transcript_25486/g.55685  ORF Transcript_25486/g.55685 Transcript_25486/m.55685 type:complete len:224 (+) Transcript_25486:619-1290(+)
MTTSASPMPRATPEINAARAFQRELPVLATIIPSNAVRFPVSLSTRAKRLQRDMHLLTVALRPTGLVRWITIPSPVEKTSVRTAVRAVLIWLASLRMTACLSSMLATKNMLAIMIGLAALMEIVGITIATPLIFRPVVTGAQAIGGAQVMNSLATLAYANTTRPADCPTLMRKMVHSAQRCRITPSASGRSIRLLLPPLSQQPIPAVRPGVLIRLFLPLWPLL